VSVSAAASLLVQARRNRKGDGFYGPRNFGDDMTVLYMLKMAF
jgi:hypothetical protein